MRCECVGVILSVLCLKERIKHSIEVKLFE